MPATGPMDHATTKLSKQSPSPLLYVGSSYIIMMLGRVPGAHLQGNATPAKPHKLRHLRGRAFQFGTADAAAAAHGRRGSNVYEVNQWLWQFGRRRARLGVSHGQ